MSIPVSVIVPCHDVEPLVRGQIDAVLPQLREADELVLVDNRSADGTKAVLRDAAAADSRIVVCDADDRPGANHARNAGMRVASGDVLLLCDADDRVRPGWVEALRSALSDGGIAGGVATPVDADGSRLGPDLALQEIFGGPPYPLGACMGVHRRVIRAVGGFDESFSGGHDETDLAWRAAAAGWRTTLASEARIDYVQRSGTRALLRQRRNYARTAVQLWVRRPETVDPHGVSLRSALRGALGGLPDLLLARSRSARSDAARAWGWSLGLVEGHLRYRVLGTPPPPDVPAIPGSSPA
ncbi:glycosyltransferase family 2 protein [Kocuria palustris]|uniref:glycosyltransferase n=1 Tax=Kocuria palustris TaxID=71999 RepID=UPI0011A2E51A|nr:glycosyltransferase family A protein [Kocuria palustris]